MTKRDAIGRPLILAIVLATGIAGAWAAAGGWILTVVDQFNYQPAIQQSLRIRNDGTPLIQSYRNYGDIDYETLEGQPVVPSQQDFLGGAHLESSAREQTFELGKPWNERIYPLSDGAKPEKYWYFIHDGRQDGAGYFQGFDRNSRRLVGYIGARGFVETLPPKTEWFPVDGRSFPQGNAIITAQYYPGVQEPYNRGIFDSLDLSSAWTAHLRCRSKLIEVDLRRRTAKVILDDPDLADIARMVLSPQMLKEEQTASGPLGSVIAARLNDRIVFLDAAGKEVASRLIPDSLRGATFIAYPLPRQELILTVSHRRPDTGKTEAAICWTDAGGRVVKRQQVTLAGYAPSADSGQAAWTAAALLPVPGIFTPAAIVAAPLVEMERGAPGYREGLERALPKIWPALLAVSLLGIALAAVAVRRQRAFGLRHRKSWAVFVFFFGVPGYLAYLCHRRWPIRKECATCHTAAPQDRETCVSCNAPFPDPPPKGIEIFNSGQAMLPASDRPNP